MITRKVTQTPYGLRLTYSLNGENYWTEYVSLSLYESPFQKKVASRLVSWANDVWRRHRPARAA